MKLLKVHTIEEAQIKLKEVGEQFNLEEKIIDITRAVGRVLYDDIKSNENIPAFTRSVVDGYAVIAKDLFGASETIPGFLKKVADIEMGEEVTFSINSGETAYIPTGGMLPVNADAVVMVEYTEKLSDDEIAVNTSIAPLNGVMQKGDDMSIGQIILKRGRKLRPQDIGVLSALGIEKVKVFEKPKVTILSTGDEIIEIHKTPEPGEVRDINAYCLMALCEEHGAEVVSYKIIKDEYKELLKEVEKASKESHIVLLSGGSSVGKKDMTSDVLKDLTKKEPFVHGLAIKPGKPTIISSGNNTVYYGLPGHPASCNIVFLAAVKPLIEFMLSKPDEIVPKVRAIVQNNIHASEGKTFYQMVSLENKDGVYYANALYGKSGAISNLSKADGYIVVPKDIEGVFKDTEVDVILL